MKPLAIVTNIVLTLGYAAAAGAFLAVPVRRGGVIRSGIKYMLAGAMGIYVFVGISHLLQFTNVTSAFDFYENYLKVLFIPLLSYAAYAIGMSFQLQRTEQQSAVLSAEHDMLMRIVDTTPNGLVVLDPFGRIEFANDKARQMLELDESPETGAVRAPAWVCGSDPDAEPGAMRCCTGRGQLRDELCTVVWPDGTHVVLQLNVTPILASDGSEVGAVAAFVEARAAASVS